MNRSLILAALLLCTLTGCWELLSWSPDGRYLAFVIPQSGEVWRWDTQRESAQSLPTSDAVKVEYLDTPDRLLVIRDSGGDDAGVDVGLLNTTEGSWNFITRIEDPYFYCVSRDGKSLYTVEQRGESGGCALVERPIDKPEDARDLVVSPTQLAMPFAGTPSQGILIASVNAEESHQIQRVYAAPPGSAPEILIESSEKEIWLPMWLNDNALLFLREGETDDEWAELVHYTLSSKSERVLYGLVYPYVRPSLHPNGKRLLVSAIPHNRVEAMRADWLSSIQLLEIEIDSGNVRQLTNETFGAALGAYNPKSNSVAYLSPPDLESNSANIRILNLETGEKTTVWRNGMERQFAAAEALYESGKLGLATATYDALAEWDPGAEQSTLARYRLAELALSAPSPDVDRAHAYIDALDSDWTAQALNMFWTPQSVIARDADTVKPALLAPEDNLEPSAAPVYDAYDIETLSARWSDDWLYLRVEINHPTEVDLAYLRPLVLLFDDAANDAGTHETVPGITWERQATRQVILKAWRAAGEDSEYDIAFLDESGAAFAQIATKGIVLENTGPIRHLGTHALRPNHSAIDLAIARDALGLSPRDEAPRAVYIQVCAFAPNADALSIADTFDAGEDETATTKIRGSAAYIEFSASPK